MKPGQDFRRCICSSEPPQILDEDAFTIYMEAESGGDAFEIYMDTYTAREDLADHLSKRLGLSPQKVYEIMYKTPKEKERMSSI